MNKACLKLIIHTKESSMTEAIIADSNANIIKKM